MTERESCTDYDAASRTILELVSVFKNQTENFYIYFSREQGRLNIKRLFAHVCTVRKY